MSLVLVIASPDCVTLAASIIVIIFWTTVRPMINKNHFPPITEFNVLLAI